MTPLYNSDSHSRHPNVPSRGRSSGQVLRPTAVRTLHRTTALGRRVNDVGRQHGSAPWPRDFKLEHTSHGRPGRLPIGVQDPATDVVVDAPLSDGRARHMERIVAGPESWEAVDGQRAVLLLGRDAACRADGPGWRSARTESGCSNRCVR